MWVAQMHCTVIIEFSLEVPNQEWYKKEASLCARSQRHLMWPLNKISITRCLSDLHDDIVKYYYDYWMLRKGFIATYNLTLTNWCFEYFFHMPVHGVKWLVASVCHFLSVCLSVDTKNACSSDPDCSITGSANTLNVCETLKNCLVCASSWIHCTRA